MRRPIILTGPPSTPESTARLYGISKRRVKELTDMVEKSLAKRSYAHLYYDSSPESNGSKRNGKKLKAKGRGRAKTKAPSNGASRARRKAARTR